MAAPVMPEGFEVTRRWGNKQPRSYAKPGHPFTVEQDMMEGWHVMDAEGRTLRGPNGRARRFRSAAAAARHALLGEAGR